MPTATGRLSIKTVPHVAGPDNGLAKLPRHRHARPRGYEGSLGLQRSQAAGSCAQLCYSRAKQAEFGGSHERAPRFAYLQHVHGRAAIRLRATGVAPDTSGAWASRGEGCQARSAWASLLRRHSAIDYLSPLDYERRHRAAA